MTKKLYVLILTIFSAFLMLLQFIPLSSQRGHLIDGVISADISTIHSKVESYTSSSRSLPKSLDDLKLSKEITSRAKSYNYTLKKSTSSKYSLCADFKTDTTSSDTSTTNPLDAFTNSSSDYSSYTPTADPYKHDKGNVCFDYTTYSSSTYNPSNIYNSSNLNNQGIDDTTTTTPSTAPTVKKNSNIIKRFLQQNY